MAKSKNQKNLLSLENGQYYASMEAVQTNVDNYLELVSSFKRSDSVIINELLSKLYTLKSTLEAQEKEFFTDYGLGGPQDVAQLQNKVNEWNATGAGKMLEHATVQAVYGIVVDRIDEAEVIKLLNLYLQDNQQFILDAIEESGVLSQVNIGKLMRTIFEGGTFSDKKVGLNTQLKIIVQNGNYQVEVIEGTKLGEQMKRNLMSLLNSKAGMQIQPSEKMLKEADQILLKNEKDKSTTEAIRQYLQSIIPYPAMGYIDNELNREKGAYARWANFFVIQGYLGEVYWNAALNYIFRTNAATIPAGNKKNIAGKSLSVDMLMRGAGFQIKAWSLKDAEINGETYSTHSNTRSLYFGNFLQSRAQIIETEVGQTIARMFGSMSYNKPNYDKGADEQTIYNQPYSKFYSKSDEEWPSTLSDLAMIFRANLSEILGISGSGGIEQETQQAYYNTFWAINNKIIPSSIIIDELIDAVRSASPTSLVEFNLDLKETKKTPTWDNANVNFADVAMANRWKIEYTTRFNLTRLLEKAANKA